MRTALLLILVASACTFAPTALQAEDLPTLPTAQPSQLPQLQSSNPGDLPSLSSNSLTTTSMPGRTIDATCYLGNPNNNQTLGSISVTAPQDAGPACNNLFFACQGRCYGCYADFDLSEDVCVDSAGRKFLR